MMDGVFWGLILMIIGGSLIVKATFKVDFPIMKLVLAFLFIYFGIRILIGDWGSRVFHAGPDDVVFKEATFVYNDKVPREQNIIFGRGVVDFRSLPDSALPAEVHINAVFGGCELLIRKEMPLKVKINSAFAGVSMPNGDTTVFGSSIYKSPELNESKPYLYIKADVAFSGLKIKIE